MSWLEENFKRLESDLVSPVSRISVYHDLPFAVFQYDPREEFAFRKQLRLLGFSLEENHHRRVKYISLSRLVWNAIEETEGDKAELAELLEVGLEGRRRVKEQLKKLGSFEYHQTSFSYIDNESREEKYVGVREEGGRALISADPLAPGSVYTASVAADGRVGLYRIEVGMATGTGKLKMTGTIDSLMRESINRAFAFLKSQKTPIGVGSILATTDFHLESIDLLSNQVPCEAGMAVVVAISSAIRKQPATPATIVLGDISIQGNVKALASLSEPLQLAMENGAKRALIPLTNKRNFLDVPGDILERVDPIFYSDPLTGAMKALGIS